MSEQKSNAAVATPEKAVGVATAPAKVKPRLLPLFKVLLHNDDKNDFLHVIESIVMLTPLDQQAAMVKTKEAHESGVALLLVTHKERAELYVEQFQSLSLTVTMESAD